MPHWSDALDGSASRRERLRKVDFINQFAGTVGVKVRDFCGSSFSVANRKGKSTITYSVEDFWAQVDALSERPLDPLDERLIAILVANNEH